MDKEKDYINLGQPAVLHPDGRITLNTRKTDADESGRPRDWERVTIKPKYREAIDPKTGEKYQIPT